MPVDVGQFGLPPAGGVGGFPGVPPTTGPTGVGDGGPDAALSALDGLVPKSPNPTVAMKKVEEAFDLAYQLVMSAIPQMSQWNPKAAGQAHTAAKTLLSLKGDLKKDAAPQPPPDLMLGMGAAGSGSPLGPASMPGAR